MLRFLAFTTVAIALAVLCLSVSGAALAGEAQQVNPLFAEAQAYAQQVATSSQPDDMKASFAQRFSALAAEQRDLWQLAGEVDGGSCGGGCAENYNNRVVAWQQQLQTFSADASALTPQGDAQVTMENHTDQTLDFYIDNEDHCQALFNLTCTAQTKSGSHALTAKNGDTVVSSTSVVLQAGQSLTWTVQ